LKSYKVSPLTTVGDRNKKIKEKLENAKKKKRGN
jgi:hypothetical protein